MVIFPEYCPDKIKNRFSLAILSLECRASGHLTSLLSVGETTKILNFLSDAQRSEKQFGFPDQKPVLLRKFFSA